MAGSSQAWREAQPLSQDFFARSTVTVARELIGCVLAVVPTGEPTVAGRIVEAEAYLDEADPASHAGRGRTPRSAIMFGPPGVAYVYLIYGMHHCLNFVTEPDGTAGAVLIRALEPVDGAAEMARRRGLDPSRVAKPGLCAGPGRLCRACGIDLAWNGRPVVADLEAPEAPEEAAGAVSGVLRVFPADGEQPAVQATPRIGIRLAQDRLYRFIARGNPHLSGP